MLNPNLGSSAKVPEEFHIQHMFRSKVKVVDKPPVYENASITTLSYMKRRKKFMRRAMTTGSYDSVGGAFSCQCERCEAQQRWMLHHHIPFWARRCGPECKSLSRFCLRNKDNKMPAEIQNKIQIKITSTKCCT